MEIKKEWLEHAKVGEEKYSSMYDHSLQKNDEFWSDQAQRVDWIKKFTKIKDIKYSSKDLKGNEYILLAKEGINGVIDRANQYVEAGANALFPEAIITLEDYKILCSAINVPVLANITEFGMTPLFSKNELKDSGISLILHPLSAFREMSKAALEVYTSISNEGNVEDIIQKMQSRDELYEILDYHTYEKKIDDLFSKD